MRTRVKRGRSGFEGWSWSGVLLSALLVGCADQASSDSGSPSAGTGVPAPGGSSAPSAGRGMQSSAGTTASSAGSSAAGRASAGRGGDPGSAGGGSGSGAAGTTSSGGSGGGPVPGADYYPLTDGATWTYRHAGGSTTWDEVVMQTAMDYMGKPAVLLVDNPGPSGTHSKTVLAEENGRVERVFREEFMGATLELTTVYDPGFLRYDRNWEKQQAGYSQTYEYERTETDASGQVTGQSGRTHRFTVEALDASVTVPAGTFDDCLRVRRSRVRAPGDPMMDGDEDLFWYCAGIGKVREESQTGGQTEELVSCNVPGGACP